MLTQLVLPLRAGGLRSAFRILRASAGERQPRSVHFAAFRLRSVNAAFLPVGWRISRVIFRTIVFRIRLSARLLRRRDASLILLRFGRDGNGSRNLCTYVLCVSLDGFCDARRDALRLGGSGFSRVGSQLCLYRIEDFRSRCFDVRSGSREVRRRVCFIVPLCRLRDCRNRLRADTGAFGFLLDKHGDVLPRVCVGVPIRHRVALDRPGAAFLNGVINGGDNGVVRIFEVFKLRLMA